MRIHKETSGIGRLENRERFAKEVVVQLSQIQTKHGEIKTVVGFAGAEDEQHSLLTIHTETSDQARHYLLGALSLDFGSGDTIRTNSDTLFQGLEDLQPGEFEDEGGSDLDRR